MEKLDDDDDDVLDMPEGLTFDVDSEEEDAEETNDNSISGKKRPLRDLDSTPMTRKERRRRRKRRTSLRRKRRGRKRRSGRKACS